MNLRTPIANVKGLGAAKEGAHHWWNLRMAALAMIPLVLWFTFSIALLATGDYATVREWIASPFNSVFMILFIGIGFYHGYLGMEEIIIDYIANESLKIATLIATGLLAMLMATLGIVSILKISFGA